MRRLLICLIFIVAASPFAHANLPQAMAQVAQEVHKFLEEEGTNSVVVGTFTAPERFLTSGGAGISEELVRALKDLKVQVVDRAKFEVTGKFTFRGERQETDNFESSVLRLRAEIVEDDIEVKQRIAFNVNVFGEDAQQIAGNTFEEPRLPDDLPPVEKAKAKEQEKLKRLADPQAVVVGNETRARKDGLFGVEVLVNSNGTFAPRKPEIVKFKNDGKVSGRSFVELFKSQEYAVRIHNHSDFEVAATLTIDGLSSYAFTEVKGLHGSVLISPGKSAEIPGWHITNEISKAFEISDYPDSAAASRGLTTDVGTISVKFNTCFPPTSKDGGPATKLGRKIEKKYTTVERKIGEDKGVISVRYRRDN